MNLPVDAGDMGLIPGSGRSPGEGNGLGNPVFLPGNPMDRGAWRTTVRGVAELDMTEQLRANTHTHTHTQEVRSSSEIVNKVTSSSAAGGRYSASTCWK